MEAFLASWQANAWAVYEYVCIFGANYAVLCSCRELLTGFKLAVRVHTLSAHPSH